MLSESEKMAIAADVLRENNLALDVLSFLKILNQYNEAIHARYLANQKADMPFRKCTIDDCPYERMALSQFCKDHVARGKLF